MSRLLVAVFFSVLSLGCSPKSVDFQLRLITQACVSPQPLDGASHLRFRVTGPDMEPLLEVVPLTDDAVKIPEIPAGKGRVIEVRAYNGAPDKAGSVVSVGRSLPFDVPDVVPEQETKPTEVTVFLRRVNTFTKPSLAVAPTQCGVMLTGRAGHSATLLQDGRVLIAGGYELAGGGSSKALASAEYYNPVTGAFDTAPELGPSTQVFTPTPRAFHTATLLANGQVLIVGGEDQPGGNKFAVATALVFDPEAQSYGGLQLQRARFDHAAVLDHQGRVLILGGMRWQSGKKQFVEAIEWYDPGSARSYLVPGELRRVGMGVAPVQGGRYIAVAGGATRKGTLLDGTEEHALTDDATFFAFDGTTFTSSIAPPVRLKGMRGYAGAAAFQKDNQLLLVGGYKTAETATTVSPVASTELVDTTANPFGVAEGPAVTARGELCTALLEDGRVFVAGGRNVEFVDEPPQASAAVELVSPGTSSKASVLGMPALGAPRYQHTCTRLADGSVLVLGGRNDNGLSSEVLGDAYIFMPAPLD